LKTLIIILTLTSTLNAGDIFFVYKDSMTQSDLNSLNFIGRSKDNDMSKVTTLVPAANTNYYVLEVNTITNAEHIKLRNLLDNGSILKIGSRWVENYFDSRTGQNVSITRTKMEKVVPKEYYTPFHVEKSTP